MVGFRVFSLGDSGVFGWSFGCVALFWISFASASLMSSFGGL